MAETLLDRIVDAKRLEVAEQQDGSPLGSWEDTLPGLPPTRDFAAALNRSGKGPCRLIAEVKKASPSRGVIREAFDPAEIARAYAAGGASAISVLTDREFFQGSLDDLDAVREAVELPLLRKDFIIDPYQVYQARRHGADAVLLIAAILSEQELREFRELAASLGMAALVEVHTEEELERALASGTQIVGINNRDLATFETDLGTTHRLAARMPAGLIRVSESGIHERGQVADLERAGIDAVLVGESLMRRKDVEKGVRALLGR